MAHRTFRDSYGLEWQVWDVIPRGVHISGPDRRRMTDRRTRGASVGRDPERRRLRSRRVAVSPEMERGWLTFQTGREKRRLAPIPSGWEAVPERQLEQLCQRALPVKPTSLL